MRRLRILAIFCLSLGLFSCNESTHEQRESNKLTTSVDSISLTKIQDGENESSDEPNNFCSRGQAKPIIEKNEFPNTTFILQSDGLTAVETVNFENGDKLTIQNWGCEYYVLTFRFETLKYHQDTTDFAYWFRAADELMTTLLGGIHSPIDIKRGLVFLDSYILRDARNNYKNLQLGEEIDFGGTEIRSFLSVDRIEKIDDKINGVTITYATGPL